MADHSLPTSSSTYTNFVSQLSARFNDLAMMLDPANTTATNVPTNAVRWNSANNRFEKWSGTAWGALSTAYAFQDITASGNVTLSGGTANGLPYLNASKVLTTGSALTFDGSILTAVGADAALGIVSKSTSGAVALIPYLDATTGGKIAAYNAAVSAFSNLTIDGTYLRFNTSNSEQMRLTSTGLGIGTSSPFTKLDVQGNVNILAGGQLIWGGAYNYYIQSDNSTYLRFATAGSERMRLNSSGNLGLGVTPSAWSGSFKALQVSNFGLMVGSTGNTYQLANAYFDGANYKYLSSSYALKYEMVSGQHAWYTAPSGTAGNPITFTQAMTLDASGNLAVGTTSAYGRVTSLTSQGVNTVANALMAYGATSSWAAGFSNVYDANFVDQILTLNTRPTGGSRGAVTYDSSAAGWAMYVAGTGGALTFMSVPAGTAQTATERARIDSSGNFGLGVTPSAWGSVYRALELDSGVALGAFKSAPIMWLGANAYHDGTNYIYKAAAKATLYQQNQGVHVWYQAGTGTAGNAISFTQAMTLHSSGGLSLGNTTDPGATNLSVSGTISDGTATLRPSVQGAYMVTTSGTAFDFVSIPSWVKKITLVFSGVSLTALANLQVQLGTSSGIKTSGYLGAISSGNNAIATSAITTGFDVAIHASGLSVSHGQAVFTYIGNNVWAMNSTAQLSNTQTYAFTAGSVSLGAALTQLRFTTNGSVSFDAGYVNIIYE